MAELKTCRCRRARLATCVALLAVLPTPALALTINGGSNAGNNRFASGFPTSPVANSNPSLHRRRIRLVGRGLGQLRAHHGRRPVGTRPGSSRQSLSSRRRRDPHLQLFDGRDNQRYCCIVAGHPRRLYQRHGRGDPCGPHPRQRQRLLLLHSLSGLFSQRLRRRYRVAVRLQLQRLPERALDRRQHHHRRRATPAVDRHPKRPVRRRFLAVHVPRLQHVHAQPGHRSGRRFGQPHLPRLRRSIVSGRRPLSARHGSGQH